MTEIIPAILPEDIDDLREKLSLISGIIPLAQIDVCDGRFAPTKTWPYKKGVDETFLRIVGQEEGFPFWGSVDFEADLMVKHPENIVDDWISAGAKRVIIHIESTPDPLSLFQKIKLEYGASDESSYGVETGVALNIETPNEEVYELLSEVDDEGEPAIDFVQFMGIENIGYQGEPFDERVFEKIRELRERFPDIIISVDGGVSLENASELIEAGANRLVSGSAIFESGDIAGTVEVFQNIG
ncbi:MAG: Ribulose-phosphate 3-epimerase [Parcubacteria group bacterium GW2011_GWA1_40_21]|nr:MAG: Ribulose-phosphate 3-epimerase [Parcubacteria group bacterium GW2011_GWC1_40_13]KKR54167.1 MAG: Ribulose-phosphate 3-epimerase [Parcubacteria group bacterium GW2011_GWA1_40_21]